MSLFVRKNKNFFYHFQSLILIILSCLIIHVVSVSQIISDQCKAKGFDRYPVILMAFDGFNPEYFKYWDKTFLQDLKKQGVTTEYMRPSYPTKTFPNLYTLVTGLYPDVHGIVDNQFKDPITGAEFKYKNESTHNQVKWGGEPIWITAEKQGIKTCVNYWPSSKLTFDGFAPTYSNPRNMANIRDVVQKLKMGSGDRPGFYTIYKNQPDHALHAKGRESPEVKEEVIKVQEYLKDFFKQLNDAGLLNCVNIIIVSDHGGVSTNCHGLIYLNQIGFFAKILFSAGPSVMISSTNESKTGPNDIFEQVRCNGKLKGETPKYSVYHKNGVPISHHYGSNERIGDLVVLMNEGTNMFRHTNFPQKCETFKGGHGYDDSLESMQAIFMARGPSFKPKTVIEPFQNIEIYDLISALLGITPAPNNGTIGLLEDALLIPNPPIQPKRMPLQFYDILPVPTVAPKKKRLLSKRGLLKGKSKPIDNGPISCCSVDIIMPSLNVSSPNAPNPQVENVLKTVSPFGLIDSSEHSLKVLPFKDFIVTYDEVTRSPSAITYIATKTYPKDTLVHGCVTKDTRLSTVLNMCYLLPKLPYITPSVPNNPFNIVPLLLYPEATVGSNIVLVYDGFYRNIWLPVMKLIQTAAKKRGAQISLGPIYDHDGNGILDDIETVKTYRINNQEDTDIRIPSHFFVATAWCPKKMVDCAPKAIKIEAYIFAHVTTPENCEKPAEYMKKNRVKVRDIEKITGLNFLLKYPENERIKLVNRLPDTK